MNRTFDPFHDIDRLFAEAARTPASVAMPMDLYRAVGTFARRLNLGSGLATDRISADYSDGVLSLTIPVAEAAKPRKIQVQHGTSGTNEIA